MIRADPEPSFETLVARLAAKAAALAQGRSEALARGRRADPRRWRDAGLVWPLFGRR